MANLKGRTLVITGGSRGIGREVALRAAKDGANVAILAKTAEPHPKLPGTIFTVAKEVDEAGGHGLGVQTDVRDEENVKKAIEQVVEKFGGIDVLINNAGAISVTPTEMTSMKRYDLMHDINVRGPFLMTRTCLPHLEKSKFGHVVNYSPPVAVEERWLGGHAAYTTSKFAMSMLAVGMAGEFREKNISVNALWPRTLIATAAIEMLMGDDGMKNSRSPAIMADATYELLLTENLEVTGQMLIDEDFLRTRGYTDFETYKNHPDGEPMKDLYID
ncbi:MAG: NAD(P)-dependent oxidoreductase [Deltaproteobacteria bacterium]|nr:NAD(P)-dependent oxidoreductase [Deltaproteobacteria bacterium]